MLFSMTRLACLAGTVLLVAALSPTAVRAQDWPTKTIRLVVPYPPGGPTDVLARIYAAKLQEVWKIDNPPIGLAAN